MTSVSTSADTDSQLQSFDPATVYSDAVSGTANAEVDDDFLDSEDEFEYLTNHYFRAGHEGCDEYTNLTTFHGMIRVFNSRNCPSLIFWCLVVTTCLVFYLLVCSTMIRSYAAQPSFMKVNKTKNVQFEVGVELCAEEENVSCEDIFTENGELACAQADVYCVSLRFATRVRIRLKKKGLYFKHGSEVKVHYLMSNPRSHHQIRLKVFQTERLNLARAPCHKDWKDLKWLPEKLYPSDNYSLVKCEHIRFNMTGTLANIQKILPCQPACFETQYKVSGSISLQHTEFVAITFMVDPTITLNQETRRTTLIDILCYLGGASSLFMGCSCVTLMEMFVFLFKLVTTSVWSKEAPEPDDSYFEEKYAFEYSDNRNRRRFAIFDRDTLEKYLLTQNSADIRSINLEKRPSTFNPIKKAPKLVQLKESRNFEHIDIYDAGIHSQSTRGESSVSPKDEFSVDYQDETLDKLGEPWIPAETPLRRARPPLRRASTATSYASHTSRGSSSFTTRSFAPTQHNNRRNSRAFTRNMPMNDF